MAEYLKIPELAQRLDVSEKTARRMVKGGKLPSVFIGGAYRVSEDDLEKYLEAARVQPGDDSGKAQARQPLQDRPRDAGRQLARLLQEARALRADEHIETAAAALDRILSERVPTAEEGLVTAEEGLAPTAEEGLFDLIEAVLEENERLKTRISKLEAA